MQIITSTSELLEFIDAMHETVKELGTAEQKSEYNRLIDKLWSDFLFSKSFIDFYGEVFKIDGNCVWVEVKE